MRTRPGGQKLKIRIVCISCSYINIYKGPSTKDVRQMGRGEGGFEISDIPGQGEGGGL